MIPDISDSTAKRPNVGTVRLTPKAIDSRLRRVFTPSVSGEYKVGSEIVKLWKSKKNGRKNLEHIFQSCGFDVDRGRQK